MHGHIGAEKFVITLVKKQYQNHSEVSHIKTCVALLFLLIHEEERTAQKRACGKVYLQRKEFRL